MSGGISGGPVNFGVFNALSPFSYVTNYGNQYQCCVMEGVSAQEAYAIQNASNPYYHLRNLSAQYASIPQYLNGTCFPTAIAQGYSAVSNAGVNAAVNTLSNQLSSLKNSIKAAIDGTEGLTDAQKQELETLLHSVEELEGLLKQAVEAHNAGATRDEVNELLNTIQQTYYDLYTASEETAQKIKDELSGVSDDNDEDDTHSDEDDTHSDEDTKVKEEKAVSAEDSYEMKQWCHDVEQAIYGLGTDDDKLDGSLARINEDNVLELIEQWNNLYAETPHYASDKQGFIETIMDDSEGSEKEVRALVFINALERRAIALGINVDAEVGAARQAVKPKSRWWSIGIPCRNDDEICKAVNALIKKVNDEEAKITGKDKVVTNIEKYII